MSKRETKIFVVVKNIYVFVPHRIRTLNISLDRRSSTPLRHIGRQCKLSEIYSLYCFQQKHWVVRTAGPCEKKLRESLLVPAYPTNKSLLSLV